MNLHDDIKCIPKIGIKTAELYNKLGIFTIKDLISYFPRNYQDWSQSTNVANCNDLDNVCINATLVSPIREHYVRRGLTLFKCDFSDGSNIIHITIFNNKYLAKSLKQYENYMLYGKIQKTFSSISMNSPKIELAVKNKGIHPIYKTTEKLNAKAISNAIKIALDSIDSFEETLSVAIREKYGLCTMDFAIRQIHFPDNFDNLKMAKRRLIFEEFLVLQLGLLKLKSKEKVITNIRIKKDYTDEFYSLLPFTPTNAQKRAVYDCIVDSFSVHPMNRLIEGDVGSGKTAVAAAVLYTFVKNGYQCALMAPTEVLATQHLESLIKLFEKTDISLALLTGSVSAKRKREIKEDLQNGKIDIVIGTHALIQSDVIFNNLGIVITDEQHRFGVNQRASLSKKGENVHTLVMSATPIPRTLALMIYGDLDISILDELPKGRQEIRTDVVDSRYHQRIYKFIRNAIDRGEQAYIVCPLVEDSESELISATNYAENLSKTAFNGYSVGLLHGKMKPKDKEAVMNDFSSGKIQILISTTVIEVGVDVPNATIMVIENAERFGLSQLHQLRGRVGRGSKKSFCVLVSDSKSEKSKERLSVMKNCSDGFKIADEDLKKRGPGDFFGNRQHGLPDLKIADMVSDIEILRLCRQCADEILLEDYKLDLPKNKIIANEISDMFRNSFSN